MQSHLSNGLSFEATPCYQNLPSKASEVISPLCVVPGEVIAIGVRVSHPNQVRKGNLQQQLDNLERYVMRHDGVIGPILSHVGSGMDFQWFGQHREELLAQGIRKVLWESVDRMIRHPAYNGQQQMLQAGPQQWQEIRIAKGELQFMTLVHPDASPKEELGYHRKRGLKAKEVVSRKERKVRLLARVLELARQQVPAHRITQLVVQEMGIPLDRSTVYRWIVKHRKSPQDVPQGMNIDMSITRDNPISNPSLES